MFLIAINKAREKKYKPSLFLEVMKKELVIFLDRDGTLIYDNKYHLGRQQNWKSKIKFLPGVMTGIKKLRKKFPLAKIYIVSNQPGIAIKNFKLLTEKRANEVCAYVMYLLNRQGAKIDGYEFSGKASYAYVKRHPEFNFDKSRVGNFSSIKPRPGMMKSLLKKDGIKNAKIYVLGDRLSDIVAADNLGGTGILIPFSGEPQDMDKFKAIKGKKILAKNFMDAVSKIR